MISRREFLRTLSIGLLGKLVRLAPDIVNQFASPHLIRLFNSMAYPDDLPLPLPMMTDTYAVRIAFDSTTLVYGQVWNQTDTQGTSLAGYYVWEGNQWGYDPNLTFSNYDINPNFDQPHPIAGAAYRINDYFSRATALFGMESGGSFGGKIYFGVKNRFSNLIYDLKVFGLELAYAGQMIFRTGLVQTIRMEEYDTATGITTIIARWGTQIGMVLKQIATPATPPVSGETMIYPKSDGKLYAQSSAGTETLIGPGLNPTATRGAVIVADATPAFSAVAIGAAGTVVRSDGTDTAFSNIGIPVVARKSSTQGFTTTTLADVTDMVQAIAANETWVVEYLMALGGAGAGGFKFAVTVPSGATLAFTGFQFSGSAGVGTTTTSGTAIAGLTGASSYGHFFATVVNGATPGNIQLQAAENAASGTSNFLINSSQIAIRKS